MAAGPEGLEPTSMSKLCRGILARHSPTLLKEIACDELFLRELHSTILTDIDLEKIKAKPTYHERAGLLLDILNRKTDSAFWYLVSALRKTRQAIAGKLVECFRVPCVYAKGDKISRMPDFIRSVTFLLRDVVCYSTTEGSVHAVSLGNEDPSATDLPGELKNAWHVHCSETGDGPVLRVIDSDQGVTSYTRSKSGWTKGEATLVSGSAVDCLLAAGAVGKSYFQMCKNNDVELCHLKDGRVQTLVEITDDDDIIDMAVDVNGTCYLLVEGKIVSYNADGTANDKIHLDPKIKGTVKAFCWFPSNEFVVAYDTGEVHVISPKGEDLKTLVRGEFCPTSLAIHHEYGVVIGTEEGVYHYGFTEPI